MSEDELAERCEQLARDVLAPLVLGGSVEPVRPIGGPLALRLGEGRRIADADLASRLDVARVRRARLLAPTDALPDLDATDWAALAGLNDLLQVTNHHLGGPLTRGRYARVLENVRWLCEQIPAPRDPGEALAHHATFARVLDLTRIDSTVSWWTGSARFRGERPPPRLLAWREIPTRARRGASHPHRRHAPRRPQRLHHRLRRCPRPLAHSIPAHGPATLTRESPAFAWSASTLALVAVGPGRMLAFRALAGEPPRVVDAVLARAAKQIPPGYEEAARIAVDFRAYVARGLAAMRGEPLPPNVGRTPQRRLT